MAPGGTQFRAEQGVKRRRKFSIHACVRIDQNPLEEDLIELSADVVGGRLVGEGAVLTEVECRSEIVLHHVEVLIRSIKLARYLKESLCDAVLLSLQ